MIDSEIRVGDVVYDLTQTSKMQVVDVAAKSVAEFRDREDFDLAGYKSHPLFDVADDEPVYTCVYLKGEVGEPGQSYDFPASRLARFPAEEANQDLRRVQEAIVLDVLEELFATAAQKDMASNRTALFDVATHAGVPEDLVDEAMELSEVDDVVGDDDNDRPVRSEPADFGGGETTGVQDLGSMAGDDEVSE